MRPSEEGLEVAVTGGKMEGKSNGAACQQVHWIIHGAVRLKCLVSRHIYQNQNDI
jgi:hypothetical protein